MAKKVAYTEAENRFITRLFLNRQDFTNGKERRALINITNRHGADSVYLAVCNLAAHVGCPDADMSTGSKGLHEAYDNERAGK